MRSGELLYGSTFFRVELVAQAVLGVIVDGAVEVLFREATRLRRPFVDDGLGQLQDDVQDCGHGVPLRMSGAKEKNLTHNRENRM